jgi:ADP-dependent NAD(P)H-hydrate dehydratase / NAD(P)H-hydrate epimerase
MKLVTADQMRAIEQSSVEAGVSLDVLMENAGLAVAQAVRDDLYDTEDSNGIFGARIVILVGPGNNGSDGFVVGRHLAIWGANVIVVLCTKRDSNDPKRTLAQTAGVVVEDGLVESGLVLLQQKLETTDVVIDAVLGIGSSRRIAEPLAPLLFAVLESGVSVVALDLPTGLNSDTGEFDIAGLAADQTLMLGYPKIGPALAGDPSVTGDQFVLDIGIPGGLDSQIRTELIDEDLAKSLHPERPHDGHKGTFGSALIIGGSQDYLGAVTMTTDAASRSGCGLTFVATPEPAYRQIAGSIPEAMYRSLAVGPNGNITASKAARTALELARKSTSVTIGPGLGNNADTTEFLSIFLSEIDTETPLVLDADALNILSGSHKWWERLENPAVLTPHPGEMGRLLGISTDQVQQNRLSIALDAAEKFNKTVVMKGSATLIAAPDGRVIVSPWVNSGLAQGGSGDVLAGLIGGLIAQSPDEPFEMAALAVYIHGYAAHFARLKVGETGMRATDVLARLGDFFRDHVQS